MKREKNIWHAYGGFTYYNLDLAKVSDHQLYTFLRLSYMNAFLFTLLMEQYNSIQGNTSIWTNILQGCLKLTNDYSSLSSRGLSLILLMAL